MSDKKIKSNNPFLAENLENLELEMLLFVYKDTFILECIELIGMKNTKKLIEAFGGKNLKLPSASSATRIIIDADIMKTMLNKNDSRNDHQKAKSLAIKYNMSFATSRAKHHKAKFIRERMLKFNK